MKEIIGIVETENPEDAGRVVFTLGDGKGNLTPCRSGAGCRSVRPKIGQRVAVVGDTLAQLIPRGESSEFVYRSLVILSPVPEKEKP